VVEGSQISPLYDPMIAKLIVHGTDREHARRRMLRALEEFEIGGVTTLLGFHRALLEHECFVAGETCHGIVESDELARRSQELVVQGHKAPPDAPPNATALVARTTSVEVDGKRYDVELLAPEPPWAALARARKERANAHAHGLGAARDAIVSPMQGTVLAVNVADGDEVGVGQVICVVEAMKMENEITAHRDGVVTELSVDAGSAVQTGQVICVVAQGADGAA
jgi:acetyl-CoA/propionyl-CoA carboxylase biotin carboxyl carrier protein